MLRYLLLAWLAAGTSAVPEPHSDEISAPLQIMHSETAPTISYVTGGIGFAERNYLASVKKDYSLEVEVALTTGEFVADVLVTVTQDDHVVLSATMDGPHLYASLPSGSYQVSATYGGDTKKQAIVIGKSGQKRTLFIWKPADDVTDAASKTPLPPLKF